jgi:tetratricopeptide (TPR) repeat protein/transcriptional regulator with XRE-family HTH domain
VSIGAPEQGTVLGTLVRAWRERALLTQEQLAERSGISVRSIRRLESGEAARPRSSSLEMLATALELSEAERASLIDAVRNAAMGAKKNLPERSDARTPPPSGAVPRQLPAAPPAFIGRVAESADLGRILDTSSVVITSIDGMAGVGKTALAVHAAHRMAGRYPDGQLFIDLQGYTEGVEPVEPGDALDRMLRALGVPGDQIPPDLDDRAALFRSRLAGRKILVLLDNAVSEAQVAPLLPGTPECLVMITSRRRLVGLDQTRVVSLDVLPLQDAIALFTSAAGEDRTAGAPAEAVREVVELCGRLPLAVRIAAARLRARPAWSVETLGNKLQDQQHLLVELEAGSRSVAAALESSYRDLEPQVRRGYGLLGLHPGAELDSYAVAALLDADVSDADRLIDQLIDAHLLQEPAPGRFAFHDLVRAHARAMSNRDDSEPDRRAAITRLLDYHCHTAAAAMDVAYPHERSRRPDVPPAHTPTPTFSGAVHAVAWLGGELPNLVAAARHAAEHGRPAHALHLGSMLYRYLYDHGRGAEASTLHTQALAAARAVGDGSGEADALMLLGKVQFWFHSRLQQAGELLEHAVATARVAGHRAGEVKAMTSLGEVRRLQGAYERAAEHFAAARESARRIPDHVAERDALFMLAWHHLWHGGPALDEFEECLTLARAADDSHGESWALHGLGHAHQLQDRFERAIECYQQALQISRAAGDQRGTLSGLTCLAYAHHQADDDVQATAHYQEALDLARQIGNPNWEYEAVHGLGRVAYAAGRTEQALAYFDRALDLATKLGQPVGDIRAHDGLARTHRALNQPEHARRHWQRVLDIMTELRLTALSPDESYGDEITTTKIRAHLRNL